MIVAGKNFGCGSSREQACSCLKGYELTIVARGFARIFLQNSINLGLNLITAPDYEASEGDEIEVAGDRVVDKTTGKSFAVVPLPKTRSDLDAGGLIAYSARPGGSVAAPGDRGDGGPRRPDGGRARRGPRFEGSCNRDVKPANLMVTTATVPCGAESPGR